MPDAGTSFTWTVKAFGPHIGWLCGWGLVVATIIVFIWQARAGAFFRGETLRHDTPALVVEE